MTDNSQENLIHIKIFKLTRIYTTSTEINKNFSELNKNLYDRRIRIKGQTAKKTVLKRGFFLYTEPLIFRPSPQANRASDLPG